MPLVVSGVVVAVESDTAPEPELVEAGASLVTTGSAPVGVDSGEKDGTLDVAADADAGRAVVEDAAADTGTAAEMEAAPDAEHDNDAVLSGVLVEGARAAAADERVVDNPLK